MALVRGFHWRQIQSNHEIYSLGMSNRIKFCCTNLLHSSNKSYSESLQNSHEIGQQTLRKQKIPPFVKDLFLGKFNKSLLSYAEILDDKTYLSLGNTAKEVEEYLNKNKDFIDQIDRTSKIHPNLLEAFKKSGLFGLSVPEDYGGAGMFYTEMGRLYEELGDSLALNDVIVTNESLGVRSLVKAGSEEVKKKYLDRVTTGECQVAWCLTDNSSGSDPSAVDMEAVLTEDGESWQLNGSKLWISNAISAELLLVFAKVKSKSQEADGITCFIVDKREINQESLTISNPHNLAGFRGVEVSDIQFCNCKIPKSAVLGNVGEGLKIVQAVANQNKYLQTFAIIKYLRNLLNETVEHCNTRQQFGLPLSEFSLVRAKLARLAGKLYSLESVAYMTAGIADASLDADIEVESVITKEFASETANHIVSECLQLLGAKVNLESSKYQKYLRDTAVLQGSTNINKCFVAISCLMHVIGHKPELSEIRQPANGNLIKSLKFQFNSFRHHINRVVLTQNLSKCFAPGLQTSGRRLEWCTHKLPYVAEALLVERGANLQIEEVYLGRLHDLASEVYVMTAVLSRASRSLTLGLDNFDFETELAVNLSFEAKQRVKQLCVETVMCDRDDSNRDEIVEHSGDYITKRGQYVAVHPLTKNSF